MPPRRNVPRKSGHTKVANSTAKSPSPNDEHAQPHSVVASSEPAPERVIQERERTLSPASSDASVAPSEEHVSESEVAEPSQKASNKKVKTHTHLTVEQEEDMIDWLKAHEVLYNKKLVDYKDTKKKTFVWQQQAEQMGVNVDELKIWYTSLRTRFTKLKKTKSGEGAPDHSERDLRVLDKFSFLAPFTYEVKKRTLVSVSAIHKGKFIFQWRICYIKLYM